MENPNVMTNPFVTAKYLLNMALVDIYHFTFVVSTLYKITELCKKH